MFAVGHMATLVVCCCTLMQVSPIQQSFVLKMLESSSFNKVLSGARECNLLMERASQIAQRSRSYTRFQVWHTVASGALRCWVTSALASELFCWLG
jgi:hypothetical protein